MCNSLTSLHFSVCLQSGNFQKLNIPILPLESFGPLFGFSSSKASSIASGPLVGPLVGSHYVLSLCVCCLKDHGTEILPPRSLGNLKTLLVYLLCCFPQFHQGSASRRGEREGGRCAGTGWEKNDVSSLVFANH